MSAESLQQDQALLQWAGEEVEQVKLLPMPDGKRDIYLQQE